MTEPKLGSLQHKVLACLEADDFALSVDEIAMDVYRDDTFPPNEAEKRSVYECLKRLERRGLTMSYRTNIADFGVVMVWRSLLTPGRKVFDPGR